MSNILYLDDFKKTHLSSGFFIETRFFEHTSANENTNWSFNNTCEENDKEDELKELVNDLLPLYNNYIDKLQSMSDISELTETLQRAFVFLNQEVNYD